jgi:membrane-associated phospholipid phosphatase
VSATAEGERRGRPDGLARLLAFMARGAVGPDRSIRPAAALWRVAASYLVFLAIYVPVNRWSVGRDARVLFLPGEEELPFLPEFEWLYVLTYVMPLLVPWTVPDVRRLLQSGVAFGIILTVACATYLVFPVYLERPAITGHSLAERLLALEYMDPSYNHFPSLHVAWTWLVFLTCRHGLGARGSAVLLGLSLAISASTVFVKQHYVVDVLYGAGLALGAWAVAGRLVAPRLPWLPRPPAPAAISPRRAAAGTGRTRSGSSPRRRGGRAPR